MIRLIQTHAAGGDACAPYDVQLDKTYTIGELINEVLETRKNEWGDFRVRNEGDSWLSHFFEIEYRYGELKGELPREIADVRIEKVHSYGGWSAMDYFIIVKKQ